MSILKWIPQLGSCTSRQDLNTIKSYICLGGVFRYLKVFHMCSYILFSRLDQTLRLDHEVRLVPPSIAPPFRHLTDKKKKKVIVVSVTFSVILLENARVKPEHLTPGLQQFPLIYQPNNMCCSYKDIFSKIVTLYVNLYNACFFSIFAATTS